MYTVQSGLRQLAESSLDEPNLVMAGVMIAAIPIVVVLLVFQRQLAARPHGRRRQGMRRARLGRRARRLAAACCSRPAVRASRSSTPATTRCRDDDDGAGDGRRPVDGAGPDDDHDARPDDDDARRSRRCRHARSTRSTTATEPVELTFWYGLQTEVETHLARADRAVPRQPGQGAGDAARTRVGYEGDDRQVRAEQPGRAGRDLVLLPEYVVQQMADSGTVIPIGACIEASGYDTSAFLPGALEAYRTERRAVVDAVQRQRPRPVLQRADVRGGRARRRRPARVARGAAGGLAGDRRLRRRRRTASPSTRASTRAARGSSSSGSPRPASCTPTTATAGWPRRRGCSSPAETGVELLTEVQSMIADGLAVSASATTPTGSDQLLQAGRSGAAGGDDDRLVRRPRGRDRTCSTAG